MKRSILFLLLSVFSLSCYSNNWQTVQLSDKQLQNIESFAKTYGFIRYFYPSRELQNFDWDRFLMHGVDKILRNENEDMTTLLHRLFSPICPEIVFSNNEIAVAENNIQPPFYIQEHHAVGEFATLFFGRDYTPITRIEESENRLQFYIYRLQDDLYVKFPLAVTEFRPRTSEFRTFERTLRRANRNTSAERYIVRIADIITRWQVIFNFYAYFEEDNLHLTWNEHSKEAIREVALSENRREYFDVMRRYFANIHDSHVRIWPNWIIINRVLAGFLQHHYPEIQIGFAGGICYIADAGAYSEKLQRGDIITMVNNIPISEFVAKRLNNIAFSTKAGGLKQLGAGGLLFESANRGGTFTLQIEKADGNTEEITITANRNRPFRNHQDRFIEKYDNGIIYINLNSRSATYENFSSRIADFQQAKGIIMDVRGRPHYESLAILSHFITEPVSLGNLLRPIISFPNRKNRRYAPTKTK